ncbi:MAG: hypothetical protein GC136_07810 [Alphaproteobacteria bacterium]|nr:hypothetical protein [Alphaproteobacteria bacterium]
MSKQDDINNCILKYAFTNAAVGIPGALGGHIDVPFLAGSWAKMIYDVARVADRPMDMGTAVRVGAAVAGGVGTMMTGMKLANSYFAYTGIGTIPAMIINASANGVVTYMVGKSAGDLITEDDPDKLARRIILSVASHFRPK